jgi:hypothetical protein
MTPDLTQALRDLQTRALRATIEARSAADLLTVQRDIVTGAQRLTAALEQAARTAPTAGEMCRLAAAWQAAGEYQAAAEAALARIEPRRELRDG